MDIVNRPDEWKIEQGLAGAKLPFLDQTGSETVFITAHQWEGATKDEAAIKAVGDRNKLFRRELEGWKGYVLICIITMHQSLLIGLTFEKLCGMGEIPGEEGKGTQDTQGSDVPPKRRVPNGANS